MTNTSTSDPFNENYREYYKDPKKVYADLLAAHGVMCNKSTTRESYEQMEKCLGLIYLYCPEDLAGIAHGFMLEATLRKIYFERMYWRKV